MSIIINNYKKFIIVWAGEPTTQMVMEINQPIILGKHIKEISPSNYNNV
jgi:hypothetical protein